MIPLLDLQPEIGDLRASLTDAFNRVLDSGQFILGPEVDALERACAAYCGARYGLGVSSGTDALLLALMALDIGPGDEVLCPSYTFFATAGAVARLQGKPVFVDIEDTYNLDPTLLDAHVTERTRAIIAVHLFGQCADMHAICDTATRHGLAVIEDGAQAFGGEWAGRKACSMGTINCTSFFPSKNLAGYGDGGMCFTNDAKLHEKMTILRNHGASPKYYHARIGGNFRLDALQAAFLRIKLEQLDRYCESRRHHAARYDELLGDLPVALPVVTCSRHVFNQYVIRFETEAARDRARAVLTEQRIGHAVYYPVPLHLQQCFSDLGNPLGSLPVSEQAARCTLAIPIFPKLTDEQQDKVSMALHGCLSNH
jgi:dTDP-4-amino-4,6-dideoxygalactose transaminase